VRWCSIAPSRYATRGPRSSSRAPPRPFDFARLRLAARPLRGLARG
jgi:hypothetical protein